MADELRFSSTVALAGELTDRLYGTLARKVREAVSNAVDAGATDIWLKFTPASRDGVTKWSATFTDNGSGMSEKDVRGQFLQLGASQKRKDRTKIGRIGIGVLALTLGLRVLLSTRTEDGSELEATLDFSPLFDPEQGERPLEDVTLGVPISVVRKPPKDLATFTRLSIPLLRDELTHELDDWDTFREELEHILPLSPHPNSPFLNYLRKHGREGLADRLATIQPAIRVWLNGEPLFRPLYNAESSPPVLVDEFQFDVAAAHADEGPAQVWGYVLDAGHKIKEPWTGVAVRLKNMLLETSWLDLTGVNSIARNWAMGELFLDSRFDDDKGLNLDRSGLMPRHPQVIEIKKKLHPWLIKFFQGISNRATARAALKQKDLGTLPARTGVLVEALRHQANILRNQIATSPQESPSRVAVPVVLRSLGYDPLSEVISLSPETHQADFVVHSIGSRPAFPIVVDRPVASLFAAMDAIGVTVGVRVAELHWEVWLGRGPNKRRVSRLRLDNPDIETTAGMLFLSKKHRWAEQVISAAQGKLDPMDVRGVTATLLSGDISDDILESLLINNGASISFRGHGHLEFHVTAEAATTSAWVDGESPLTMAKTLIGCVERVRDLPSSPWAVVLPDPWIARTFVHGLVFEPPQPRISLRVVPIMPGLIRVLGNEHARIQFLGITVDRGNGRVETTVFREEATASLVREVVSGGTLVAARVAVNERPYTILANHYATFPAPGPSEVGPWVQDLLWLAGE